MYHDTKYIFILIKDSTFLTPASSLFFEKIPTYFYAFPLKTVLGVKLKFHIRLNERKGQNSLSMSDAVMLAVHLS